MTRIGYLLNFDSSWVGGINYFRNLLSAVYSNPNRSIEAIVFVGSKSKQEYFAGFPNVEIVRTPILDRWSFPWMMCKGIKFLLKRDVITERLLIKHGVALLSHSGWLGINAKVPTLAWLADFQHVHLPNLFNSGELRKRDAEFKRVCKYSDAILVSSKSAQNDLADYIPACVGKSFVLNFAVMPNLAPIAQAEIVSVLSKYKLPEKFILLPNQFWAHKNHKVVVDAMSILSKSNSDITVVCTGNTSDYRNPGYFAELMDKVSKLNVENSFVVLGMVPNTDLSVLMSQCIAILNPSKFEGWSTSVEEAKSLGIPVILSDIPVHREQRPNTAMYFMPDDAEGLACAMEEVWRKPPAMSSVRIEYAKEMMGDARKKYYTDYENIVNLIIRERSAYK